MEGGALPLASLQVPGSLVASRPPRRAQIAVVFKIGDIISALSSLSQLPVGPSQTT
jgi:hypothetical protein